MSTEANKVYFPLDMGLRFIVFIYTVNASSWVFSCWDTFIRFPLMCNPWCLGKHGFPLQFFSWSEKLSLSASSVKAAETYLYSDLHLCVVLVKNQSWSQWEFELREFEAGFLCLSSLLAPCPWARCLEPGETPMSCASNLARFVCAQKHVSVSVSNLAFHSSRNTGLFCSPEKYWL